MAAEAAARHWWDPPPGHCYRCKKYTPEWVDQVMSIYDVTQAQPGQVFRCGCCGRQFWPHVQAADAAAE
eukprot:g8210.t1